jgi:hypothetical protein
MMPSPASASRKTLGLFCMGLPGADIFVDLDLERQQRCRFERQRVPWFGHRSKLRTTARIMQALPGGPGLL